MPGRAIQQLFNTNNFGEIIMGYIDNLNDSKSEIRDLMRRIRQLETASPLGHSSITRGALRVASPEGLIVEGSEKVTGTLTLTPGSVLDVTGETNLHGPTTIDGTLDVKGATTLSNDLNVAAGGGITIDSTNPLKLSPDGSHAIEWASGAYLQSNDGGVGIGANGFSAAFVAATDGSAALYYPNGHIAVWTSAVNGLSFYSPDGTKVMRLTNTGLVGP